MFRVSSLSRTLCLPFTRAWSLQIRLGSATLRRLIYRLEASLHAAEDLNWSRCQCSAVEVKGLPLCCLNLVHSYVPASYKHTDSHVGVQPVIHRELATQQLSILLASQAPRKRRPRKASKLILHAVGET